MLRLGSERSEVAVVDDQVGSPTWTYDLALAIKALIDKGCRGTYHAANSGFVSWNGFAREIFRLAALDVTVTPTTTAQFALPAARPLYSTLDCGKLIEETGFVPRPWQEALKRYLELRGDKSIQTDDLGGNYGARRASLGNLYRSRRA
jgi:dTDP-4-dehydrorhamnose reductase